MQRDSVPALDQRPPRLRKLYRALEALDVDGDRVEARLVRRLQWAMAMTSMGPIAGLGVLFAVQGHLRPALWAAGYVAVTLAFLGAVVVTGKFAILRVPHPLLVALAPSALAIDLGGFRQSGGLVMWTLITPFAAMMFGLRRRSLYFAVSGACMIAVFATARPEVGMLTARELEIHFVYNLLGFLGFLYVSLRYFVTRIDQEKARAEELLRRTLPEPIVRRLKRGQTQIADYLEGVTVVFADIVGFTPLAARLSPAELVQLLDEVFTKFDALAEHHGVEKIKTIGDAYMAAAGAPVPCRDHAARAARLALAMREVVAEIAKARDIELGMRIGLHTGEVVAGVIGTARFAYDLWGDTVNTASRMESHGAPGQIQVTAATRAALGEGFALRERGPIEVKGRGTVVTYWLEA